MIKNSNNSNDNDKKLLKEKMEQLIKLEKNEEELELQLQKLTDPELLNEMQKKSQMRKELYNFYFQLIIKKIEIMKYLESAILIKSY
jgi:hypothetical protein